VYHIFPVFFANADLSPKLLSFQAYNIA